MRHLFPVAAISIAVLVSPVMAAHNHHDGAGRLGNRIHQPGKHHLHNSDRHKVHAHVNQNGKISHVSAVHHQTGKHAAVKKFKSRQRQHGLQIMEGQWVEQVDQLSVEAMGSMATDNVATTLDDDKDLYVYIGWGFMEHGYWVVYWFLIDDCEGGDYGAEEWVYG